MKDPSEAIGAFLDDTERHNQWWSPQGTDPADLHEVSELTPRSDVANCLKELDRLHDEEIDELFYPIYGPTGIGKTTLLLQLVAAMVPDEIVSFDPSHRDLEVVGSVEPRRVLYVPLEDSLYHLEPPEEALEKLRSVVDYFYTHIAPRDGRKFVLLDDVGALHIENEEKHEILDLIDSNTSLIVTGIVESEVDVSMEGQRPGIRKQGPYPMLPMKFIDTVQLGVYDELFGSTTADVASVVETQRTTSMDGASLIADVRSQISDPDSLSDAVAALERLHFDVFSETDRDGLHQAARRYIQTGGLFQRVNDDAVNNELVNTHFLLYLYKELAQYESIQNPENLHRLASLAASRAGEELEYTDISERLGADRRTVDTYLSLLEEGLSVSQSHDFSLQRHRRTRLYLRNPRHVVLLSQRQEHFGFESYEPTGTLNQEFEYKLAKTVAFDHAKRLSYKVTGSGGDDPPVDYCETDVGTIEYLLQHDGLVLPFVLSYHPHANDAVEIARTFDPTVGKPTSSEGGETGYHAPYRFVISDSLPKKVRENESLVDDRDGAKLCYLPYWLFLLIA